MQASGNRPRPLGSLLSAQVEFLSNVSPVRLLYNPLRAGTSNLKIAIGFLQEYSALLRYGNCSHAFSEAGSGVGHEVVRDEGCHPEGWEGLQGHQCKLMHALSCCPQSLPCYLEKFAVHIDAGMTVIGHMLAGLPSLLCNMSMSQKTNRANATCALQYICE